MLVLVLLLVVRTHYQYLLLVLVLVLVLVPVLRWWSTRKDATRLLFISSSSFSRFRCALRPVCVSELVWAFGSTYARLGLKVARLSIRDLQETRKNTWVTMLLTVLGLDHF